MKTVTGICLGVVDTGWFRQTNEKTGYFLPNRLTISDLFEGPWLVGARFRRHRPP